MDTVYHPNFSLHTTMLRGLEASSVKVLNGAKFLALSCHVMQEPRPVSTGNRQWPMSKLSVKMIDQNRFLHSTILHVKQIPP
jgi:hypothetical protein